VNYDGTRSDCVDTPLAKAKRKGGRERAGREDSPGEVPAARQTSTRLEGEAALGVEVAKPAARRRVGAGGWEWGESAGSDYWLGGPG